MQRCEGLGSQPGKSRKPSSGTVAQIDGHYFVVVIARMTARIGLPSLMALIHGRKSLRAERIYCRRRRRNIGKQVDPRDNSGIGGAAVEGVASFAE